TSETPTYIATVPRRGYRFLDPVVEIGGPQGEPVVDLPAQHSDRGPAGDSALKVPLGNGRSRDRFWMAVAAVLSAALLAVAARALRTTAPPPAPVVFTIAPPDGTKFSTTGGFMAVS